SRHDAGPTIRPDPPATIGASVRQPIGSYRGARMTAIRRRSVTGLLFPTPAVLFVLAFTAYPFLQMVAMSFTNWSLITPPRPIGLANFQAALNDRQFWTSLAYPFR